MLYTRFKRSICLSVLMALAACADDCEAQHTFISHWSVEDGLTSNDVRDLLQDDDGMMWIATGHGLNRFDGYSFTNFRFKPGDTTSIGANYINSVCHGTHNNLWVNLGVGIISNYDKRSGQFSNVAISRNNGFAFDLQALADGDLLVASNAGLFVAKTGSSDLEPWVPKSRKAPIIAYHLFAGPSEQIYFNTDSGLLIGHIKSRTCRIAYTVFGSDTTVFNQSVRKCHVLENGTVVLQSQQGDIFQSPDGQHFRRMILATSRSPSRSPDFVFSDPVGNVWVMTDDRRLISFEEGDSGRVSIPNQPAHTVLAFSDQQQNLWVMTAANDLWKWNGQHWDHVVSLHGRLNYWEIYAAIADRDNGIWIASKGKGLWRVKQRPWPISELTWDDVEPGVTMLKMHDEKSLWIGSFGRLCRYDLQHDGKQGSNTTCVSHDLMGGLRCNDILKTNDGDYWIATHNGLVITNAGLKRKQHIREIWSAGRRVHLNYVRCIQEDAAGRIWVGSANGLFVFDKNSRSLLLYHTGREPHGPLSGYDIQCMTMVTDSSCLIGYVKNGVDLLTFRSSDTTVSGQHVEYLAPGDEQFDMMTTNTIFRNGSEYWVGTFSRGLLTLSIDDLTMAPLHKDFPVIPNIKGILSDVNGDLWVSAIDGVRSLNPVTLDCYKFTKSSGLVNNVFRQNCVAKSSEGVLYFGGADGINRINPAEWTYQQDSIAQPVLTGIKLYDQNIVADVPLNTLKSVQISHRDDYITFHFVSPTFDNPHDVQYAYQLEGLDAGWRDGSAQRSATYTNLKPGAYVFKVRASNKGGYLHAQTKQIALNVSTPFWQASWFIALMAGLAGILIWAAFRLHWSLRMARIRVIADVRKKAAIDFHDDLGHRLTKISLLTETLMLQRESLPESTIGSIQKLRNHANALYHSTRDFIWAMNPSKDSALDLCVLLRDFGDELFEDTPIHFCVEGIREDYKRYPLNMDWKRQLVLIFKEAMHNALKHANCTQVKLKIDQRDKHIQLALIDNGIGFVKEHNQFGYGLGSMINRSKRIGGRLEIHSLPGKGTEVFVEI